MQALEELKSAVRRLPGPTPNFNFIHAVLMLLFLEEGVIGRKRLSEMMEIGEGSVRSLIRRLRKAGYVEVGREGCYLTRKGQRRVKELRKFLKGPIEVELPSLAGGKASATLVKLRGKEELKVVELRDEAVRAGGRGAIILLSRGGGLFFPETMEPLGKYRSDDELVLITALQPSDGDLVVVGLGDSSKDSMIAALAVSLTMLDGS